MINNKIQVFLQKNLRRGRETGGSVLRVEKESDQSKSEGWRMAGLG